ncbi:hypothetical protein [Arthrobacter sp. Leaf69]|uniref:hypothetical protein n=1 Tax=Arthrobacter sp. Leaf69 TaxID=1736232 RepID=UPI0012E1DD7B|nr:hypothetical protein [Arthrobacter sp. Leaf69]
MPKKPKTPAPIRPDLIEPLAEILRGRGLDVRQWPADEAAAYRDNGGFQEGVAAIQQVKMSKSAAAIEKTFEEVVRAVELKAYLEGVSAAGIMKPGRRWTTRCSLRGRGISSTAAAESPITGRS